MMKRITWRGWVAMALVFITGTVLPACIGQLIDADPPAGAVARGLSDSMKLDESVRAYNAYSRQESAFLESWAENIAEGEEKAAAWSGVFAKLTSPEALVSYGLSPANGLITAGIFGAGLFFRRPGDVPKEKLASEKEDSYNAGLEKREKLDG